MSIIINSDMSLATITAESAFDQSNSVMEMKMGYEMGYEVGIEPEVQKPTIFANTIFLVILTVVVVLAGVGAGLLIAKKKIKKGLDYDENY